LIGKTISHYKIIEKLGEGGMGEVYLAEDTDLHRKVAIKFLPEHLTRVKDNIERFRREAQAAAALNHPKIVTIYEIAEEDDRTFIVMEYVDGITLREVINSNAQFPITNYSNIISQICEGLSKAHQSGIVHRDIKPENIIIDHEARVKILDFGLAKLKGVSKLTKETSTLGTIHYTSPEQLQGKEVDHRSDIWSLGVVLYEMLTGQLPFRGEYDSAIIYSILNEAPQQISDLCPEVPRWLEILIEKALSKSSDDRFQSLDEMITNLRYGSEIAISLKKKSFYRSALLKFKKRKFLLSAIISLMFIIIVGLINLLSLKFSGVETKSIAILPFTNLSSDQTYEYISDGITEDIITQVSKISELRVLSRSSIMRYKNKDINIKKIGKDLNVSTVLEGSVRIENNSIRVAAQLIDTNTDAHLWAEIYDKELTRIFDIQSEVANEIASALKVKLTPSEKTNLEKKATKNLEAYSFYLKGKEYYNKYNKEDNETAIELFKRALKRDAGYSLAYAGLGNAYGQRYEKFGYSIDWLDSSIAISEKAILIDPDLAEGYKALGLSYHLKGWRNKAVEANKKAIELNPNLYPAIGNLGIEYMSMGKLDESLLLLQKAISLNPTHFFGRATVGAVFYELSMDDEALDWYRKAMELEPNYTYANIQIGYLYLRQGNFEKALSMASEDIKIYPDTLSSLVFKGNIELFRGNFSKSKWYYDKVIKIKGISIKTITHPINLSPSTYGYILTKTGNQAQAQNLLAKISLEFQIAIKQGNEYYGAPFELARINAIQGKKGPAYRWLQKAIDAGWRDYRLALIDPVWENLRGDHQFKTLMIQIKYMVEMMRYRVQEIQKE